MISSGGRVVSAFRRLCFFLNVLGSCLNRFFSLAVIVLFFGSCCSGFFTSLHTGSSSRLIAAGNKMIGICGLSSLCEGDCLNAVYAVKPGRSIFCSAGRGKCLFLSVLFAFSFRCGIVCVGCSGCRGINGCGGFCSFFRGSKSGLLGLFCSGDPDFGKFHHLGCGLDITGFTQQIPVFTVPDHTGDQCALFIKIIIFTIDLDPARSQYTIFVKIIFDTVDSLPAADTVAVLIQIESFIVDRKPANMIGTVIFNITPSAVFLIPLRRPVHAPEGSAGQIASVDRNTAAAGGCLKMIAIILSGTIGTI